MIKDDMKNKIIEELQFFKGIDFHEEQHFYTLNDYRFGISATSLIETYAQEFDSDGISQMVANKRGISQKEVLDEWKKENEFSCIKGSCIHLKAQSLWMGTDYEIDYNTIDDTIDKDRLKKEYDIMSKQATDFYNDYKDMYDMIQDEFIVWSKEFDIAGSIDGIMYNKNTQQCCILDFKSNKDLQFKSKYRKKMKVPLHELDDVNGQHYYIQLSIYKYLIEKYTNIKVDELFIVYFNINADSYEIIEIPYLKKEVEEILKLRRANKMAKMLLIIGEGGSGKTSSLKNLSPKEHFYIDCDKKGLNYKGWKEDYIEKKNYFKTNDGEIVAKLLQEISNNKPEFKYVTIDTINSIMIADEMKRMKGKSYNEWQDLAKCIFDLIDIVPDLRDDLTVIFIGHTQTEDDGFTRLLTNGRKLNKIGLEKYFNTVLLSKAKDGEYIFETRANNSTARTPMDAFDELEIPNDITKVLEVIKDY